MDDWGERDPAWRGVRSDTIDVDGTAVHLLRAGPEHPGATPPTLLVHGLGGTAANWIDVIGPLAEDGPVVAMDLPGFGRTEPPDPRAARLRPQVKFLGRLLDVLGWDRAIVHGNSMGGLLSILLAADRPDRVTRLVLTSPAVPPPRNATGLSPTAAARFAPFVSWRLGTLALERVHRRMSPERVRRGTIKLVLGELDDVRPSLRQVQLENVEFARTTPWRAPSFARAAADVVSTLARARRVHRAVEAVAAPALVIWGDLDQLVSGAAMDSLVARRPDWQRVDLDGVGHVAMMEAPDRWLAAVQAWMDLQSSDAAAGDDGSEAVEAGAG